MSGPYDDIINLPHHVSSTRPRMSSENRAAQFSPFAALTGYDAAVKETGRLTDKRIELDDNAMAQLDMKLHMLSDRISQLPEVSITHFKEDEKKDGGVYITTMGRIKKIDIYKRLIVFEDDDKVEIDDVIDIDIMNEFI